LKTHFCFAGLPNPASSEAFFLFFGLDLASQACGRQISKHFLSFGAQKDLLDDE
jgi:hypothetical protein